MPGGVAVLVGGLGLFGVVVVALVVDVIPNSLDPAAVTFMAVSSSCRRRNASCRSSVATF